MSVVNNNRIAKNTLALYIRMLLLMAVSFYTSRVILKVLGVDDYGIYNLVGGFVTLFSFVSSALVNAMQRFFNVSLGENDTIKFQNVYSMGISIMVLFSLILLIVCETIGVWFIGNQLNIPTERQFAANWVFQFSIITFIVQLIRTPDNAAIIAYEKINFYAIISIGEAIIKLLIVFFLINIQTDKLILYSCLYLSSTIIINIVYKLYCNRNFKACKFKFVWNKVLFKSLLNFSGWSLLAQGTNVGENQGESFLINHYYSVSLNAARGVSAYVYNTINTFLINFYTSFKPQLIKSYAAGEYEDHFRLLYRSARYSFLLLSLVALPAIFNLVPLLNVWLEEVPQYTREFSLYVIIAYLIDSLQLPLSTSISANGNIKGYMIWCSIAYTFGFILSFYGYKYFDIPYIASLICVFVHFAILCFSLLFAKKNCKMSIRTFLKNVFPLIMISLILMILGLMVIHKFLNNMWITLFLDVFLCGLISFFCGLKKDERIYIFNKIKIKYQDKLRN